MGGWLGLRLCRPPRLSDALNSALAGPLQTTPSFPVFGRFARPLPLIGVNRPYCMGRGRCTPPLSGCCCRWTSSTSSPITAGSTRSELSAASAKRSSIPPSQALPTRYELGYQSTRLLASRYLSDWWNAITWMNYGLFAYNMMQYFSVGDKVPQRGKVELAATVKSEYVCSDRW